ncbi:baeyer-Villiger monooxygenase [Folsomia candida]|uniref:Flavin-containing monooxygenase n=1 Tax=Folsomia candida TaxID=158441 RepID=A0A226EVE8_FOLCA|nr:baeyer-Villiger monooxygenase [Folsomia candida]OXA60576.1 Baeyer-Villiger monooxygenase [Folsomia candida]
MGSAKDHLDVLIIGAGFCGLHTLNKLRKSGFSAKIYERSSGLGGVWQANRYPGARVDIETPAYQLSDKELWQDFDWGERYPGRSELLRYFNHVDKKLGLSKDIEFNTTVVSSRFDESRQLWCVKTDTGLSTSTWAKYFILCTGFTCTKYIPEYKGLDKFKGIWHHSALWPEDTVDLTGKRVAVVGTGASGVQIIQTIGPHVSHLTVYQRTPNMALPMRQCSSSDEKINDGTKWTFPKKDEYERIFQKMRTTFAGIRVDFTPQKFQDATPSERRALYEDIWAYGGFSFWLANYIQTLFDQEANDEAYGFWCEKTRARIHSEEKKELLAPMKPVHAWGTKHPSLEQSYYEVFNQDNVDIIDVRESPIIEMTETGIRTEKEGVIDFDVIILATGFDTRTGGMLNIDIRNGQGKSIQQHWENGIRSYLGMMTNSFPNLFWCYGQHSPAAFSNGPHCGEVQGDWITELLLNMRETGREVVEAEKGSEDAWGKNIKEMWHASLYPKTESLYQGNNIPGRKPEPIYYFGGIPAYVAALKNSKVNNYQGFDFK